MDISIVIPTLNEADYVEKTIAAGRAAGASEIIVADGGSSDRTVELARAHCRTIAAPRGRARQMNAGALEAAGDVLLFLHADTLLPPNALEAARNALSNPMCVAGCFRLRFDETSPLLQIYAALARLPLKSLCFGDRAHFMLRNAYEAAGGFPEIPVFEDLEMVKRVSRLGTYHVLRESVTTSARRFAAAGPLRQQLLNAFLWTQYQLGASPQNLARYYTYGEH